MTISNKIRGCIYPGCKRKGRNKGNYNGSTRYDCYCEYHHRLRCKKNSQIYEYIHSRKVIDNSKCDECGWNKAPCDRHRINPKEGYTRENIKILCPNCHRLVSLGLLK